MFGDKENVYFLFLMADGSRDKEMGHLIKNAVMSLLSRHLAANALPSSLAAEFPAILTPADLKFQGKPSTHWRT
jgi:hypothetical protein